MFQAFQQIVLVFISPPLFVLGNYRLSPLISSFPPHLLISFDMSFANISVADVLGLNNRVGPAPGTLVGSSVLSSPSSMTNYCLRMTLIQRRLLSGTSMVSWKTNLIRARSSRLSGTKIR